MSAEEADILTGDRGLGDYFEAALAEHPNAQSVARWLLNNVLGLVKDLERAKASGAAFGRFVALVDQGRITTNGAKVLLTRLFEQGGEPEPLISELKLDQGTDAGALTAALERVLGRHAAEVARYRSGEKKLLGVLLGAMMREAQGADAAQVRKLITDRLGSKPLPSPPMWACPASRRAEGALVSSHAQ